MKTSFARKERKYLLSSADFQAFLEQVRVHMDFDTYCPNGSFYAVSNIYYDNNEHHLIRKSLLGLPYKEKIRLRAYQKELNDDSLVCFELKRKVAKVVNKRRVMFKLKQMEEYFNSGKLPVGFGIREQQILKEINHIINQEQAFPKIFLAYERLALFDKLNANIRITFDRNLIFREENVTFRANFEGARLIPEEVYLIEIKVDRAIPLYLANILTSFRIFPTSFSKYGKYYEKKLGGL